MEVVILVWLTNDIEIKIKYFVANNTQKCFVFPLIGMPSICLNILMSAYGALPFTGEGWFVSDSGLNYRAWCD